MKITINPEDKNVVNFGDLHVGDVFRFDGDVCIKITSFDFDKHPFSYLRLGAGSVHCFSTDMQKVLYLSNVELVVTTFDCDYFQQQRKEN
jgi:hypothetical protein